MSSTETIAARLAEWAASVTFEDLPKRVLEEAKNQMLSVVASAHAGYFSDIGKIAARTMKDREGGREATSIPAGEKLTLQEAIFMNCALAMALDYDDYLFAGHTGHSAALATLSVGEKLGSSGREILLAQVVANEIAGRLGAAVLLGPLNGQMWSFLHMIGSAVATAKLMGLNAAQIENAIGIALVQPSHPLRPGFFGSEGKILLAATTAPVGVRAAELAANGLRGNGSIFEGPDGLLALFSPKPLLGAFGGLGQTWLTDTLCFKLYPGCAYIDTTIDCILHLVKTHAVAPAAVRAIRVAATPLTLGMEALVAPYLRGAESLPTTLNFSLPYNVAVSLVDKELTARQFRRERVSDPHVWELAGKVHLELDDEMSRRMRDSALVQIAYEGEKERYRLDLDTVDLRRFRMSFGARVRIEMADGKVHQMEQEVPFGGAGRPADERRRAVEDKFRRETRYVLKKPAMEHAIELIEDLDAESTNAARVRELIRACCSEKE